MSALWPRYIVIVVETTRTNVLSPQDFILCYDIVYLCIESSVSTPILLHDRSGRSFAMVWSSIVKYVDPYNAARFLTQ